MLFPGLSPSGTSRRLPLCGDHDHLQPKPLALQGRAPTPPPACPRLRLRHPGVLGPGFPSVGQRPGDCFRWKSSSVMGRKVTPVLSSPPDGC